jgi:hypothetical protein
MNEVKKDTKNEELRKAFQVLAEDREQRMQACMQEIQVILQKYGFDLSVSDPIISLVARPEQSLPPHSARS